jgi:hypothetical protein
LHCPRVSRRRRQLLEAWQLRDDALHGRGAASGEGLLVHQARQRRRQQQQQHSHQRQQKRKRLDRKRQRQDGAGGVAAAPTHGDAAPENEDDGDDEDGDAEGEQEEVTCDAALAAWSAAMSSFEEGSQAWPQAAWYLAGQVGEVWGRRVAGFGRGGVRVACEGLPAQGCMHFIEGITDTASHLPIAWALPRSAFVPIDRPWPEKNL